MVSSLRSDGRMAVVMPHGVLSRGGEEKACRQRFITDAAKEKAARGKVISLGSGKLNDEGERTPLQVKMGDRVIFSKYAGTELEINEQKLLIMREDDILAILE
jgi:chaperonin GroES